MNQLSLVQAVNRFGESVVIAVTPTSDRRLDARFGQPLAVPDRHILLATIGMLDQRFVALRLPVIQGLLQCIKHKVCSHGTALPTTHYRASVDVNHKGYVLPALPG